MTPSHIFGFSASFALILLVFSACATPPSPPSAIPRLTSGQADPPTVWQAETFGPLAALAGRTLRGEGQEPGGAKLSDVQVWSWALDGHVLRNVHVLADGSYGGETLIYRDAATGGLAYVYVTSAGFRTEGTMSVGADGTLLAEEAVLGHPRIRAVRSKGVIGPDFAIDTQSEFVTDTGTEPGHAFRYVPWDGPLPVLRPPLPKLAE